MKKDLTKHTRSAWKQPVWWKYIVAFFIDLIDGNLLISPRKCL